MTLLGPQPSTFRCCPSCRIVARAVVVLLEANERGEMAKELREMLGEDEDAINTEAVNQ